MIENLHIFEEEEIVLVYYVLDDQHPMFEGYIMTNAVLKVYLEENKGDTTLKFLKVDIGLVDEIESSYGDSQIVLLEEMLYYVSDHNNHTDHIHPKILDKVRKHTINPMQYEMVHYGGPETIIYGIKSTLKHIFEDDVLIFNNREANEMVKFSKDILESMAIFQEVQHLIYEEHEIYSEKELYVLYNMWAIVYLEAVR